MCRFVLTVLTTLPVRTASQGESFAFKEIHKYTWPLMFYDSFRGFYLLTDPCFDV